MKNKRLLTVLFLLILVFVMAFGTALAVTELKITTQPKNVTVASGATAKVTLKASGDGLTYKWYYNHLRGRPFGRSMHPDALFLSFT